MKDKVSAIQHRQWQQVEKAHTDRNGRADAEKHPEQLFHTLGLCQLRLAPHLVDDTAGNVANSNRAGHGVERHLAGHDSRQHGDGPVQRRARFSNAGAQCLNRIVSGPFAHRDAGQHDPGRTLGHHLSKLVFPHHFVRRHLDAHGLAVTQHVERHFLVGIQKDRYRHGLGIGHRLAVHGNENIAGGQTALLCRRAFNDARNTHGIIGLAVHTQDQRENQAGQDKIRHRTGNADKRPLPDGEILVRLALRPLFDLANIPGKLALADKFHETAQGNPVHAPTRSDAVLALVQGLAEADRERFHGGAIEAAHKVVTQFMHDHDNAHHEDEACNE